MLADSEGIGGSSDLDGNFVITNVPVGRHTIKANHLGYEPIVLKEQLLSAGKEMVLELKMREYANELGEVVVKPRVSIDYKTSASLAHTTSRYRLPSNWAKMRRLKSSLTTSMSSTYL